MNCWLKGRDMPDTTALSDSLDTVVCLADDEKSERDVENLFLENG